jgi:hypothetical protein
MSDDPHEIPTSTLTCVPPRLERTPATSIRGHRPRPRRHSPRRHTGAGLARRADQGEAPHRRGQPVDRRRGGGLLSADRRLPGARPYGSVGIVVLVLAWFLVSAFSVLLGAEVNAELERQTRQDTTVGDDKPAGARGAVVADTMGDP